MKKTQKRKELKLLYSLEFRVPANGRSNGKDLATKGKWTQSK